METIQQPTSKRKRLFIITLMVIVCCLWSLLALYAILGGKEDNSIYAPNVVYTAPAAPVSSGSSPAFYSGSRRSGSLMYHHSAPTYTQAPATTMRSTSSAPVARVYQTSNATVRSYGGGGTGGAVNTFSRRQNNGSGVSYAAYNYSGVIYLPTRSNAVTAVGAKEAANVAAQKMGAPRRIRMDNGEGEYPVVPEDPAPDPEPPVPAGDLPWLMMLLLAGAYALRIALRRKANENAG